MSLITLKNLRVFRGTLAEILEKQSKSEVEDKTIYLAWDSQEIYIGNARGALIKYGGTKNLDAVFDTKFNAFKQELNELITTLATTAVNESLESRMDTFYQTFSTDISALTTRVNEINTSLTSQMSTFEDSVNNRISQISTETNQSVNSLSSAVESLSSQVSAFQTTVNGLSNDSERVTAVETSLSNLSTQIQTLSSAINSLQSLKHINYMTGDELETYVSETLTNVGGSSFIPTLCIRDSANYSAGTIYYWNGTELAEASGGSGGSTVTTLTGNVSAQFVGAKSYCISNTALEKSFTVSFSGEEAAIKKGTLSFTVGNSTISYVSGADTYTTMLNLSSPGFINLSVSAEANPNPNRRTEYAVTSSGDTIEVYVPVIIDGQELAGTQPAELTIENTPNQQTEILVYEPLSSIHFGSDLEDYQASNFYQSRILYTLANGSQVQLYKYLLPAYGVAMDIILKK